MLLEALIPRCSEFWNLHAVVLRINVISKRESDLIELNGVTSPSSVYPEIFRILISEKYFHISNSLTSDSQSISFWSEPKNVFHRAVQVSV